MAVQEFACGSAHAVCVRVGELVNNLVHGGVHIGRTIPARPAVLHLDEVRGFGLWHVWNPEKKVLTIEIHTMEKVAGSNPRD